MYQPNEKVVYLGHGVAVIETIIEKKVGEKSLSFFKLNFLYKDMTVLVPTKSIEGIRRLGSHEDIERALNELHKSPKKIDTSDFTPSSWNKRNKSYQLKIQGGKLLDIACIYRDLMYAAKYKELSFGEKSLLQVAEDLLLQEIQMVKKTDRDLIMQELRNPFKQFSFEGHSPVGGESATVL